MKLLIFHPGMSPEDPLVRSLQSSGVGVLLANSLEQARTLLSAHGRTLDAGAVIHREPDGLELIPAIKSAVPDLPYIITSSEWTEADFVRHQDGPQGANAYLTEDRLRSELRGVLEQVLGRELAASAPESLPVPEPVPEPAIATPPPAPGFQQEISGISVNFEDATSVFDRSAATDQSKSFVLEVDSVSEPPAPPGATPSPASSSTASSDGATRVVGLDGGDLVSATPGEPGEPALVLTRDAAPDQPAVSTPDEASIVISDLPAELELRLDVPSGGASVAAPNPVPAEPPPAPEGTLAGIPIDLSPSTPGESAIPSFSSIPSMVSTPSISVPPPETAPAESAVAVDASAELPYLFGQTARPRPLPMVGDAVVPGGAAQSPDVETLKRYLLLREQDVVTLGAQLQDARQQIRALEADIRQCHALMEEQGYRLEGQERREQEYEREKALLTQGVQAELDEARFDARARTEKVRQLESQVREAAQEMERLRERVRQDIRKIRAREKELENRIEMVKSETGAVLAARESMILELKRKLDTAEFNLDLAHDRLGREKDVSAELREKLVRASQAVRLAGGLLDPADSDAAPSSDAGRSSERPDRKVS